MSLVELWSREGGKIRTCGSLQSKGLGWSSSFPSGPSGEGGVAWWMRGGRE